MKCLSQDKPDSSSSKTKFHQSGRSKTRSQTCVTRASGSQTSRKHVANHFEDCTLLTAQVTCVTWPVLGRKRARSITTCWDRSSTLSTRFSTRKVLSLSWAGRRPCLAGRKPGVFDQAFDLIDWWNLAFSSSSPRFLPLCFYVLYISWMKFMCVCRISVNRNVQGFSISLWKQEQQSIKQKN